MNPMDETTMRIKELLKMLRLCRMEKRSMKS